MSDTSTADEVEIRNLVAKLAYLADNATIDELDEYVNCFTEDATWGMPGSVAHGRAEILAGAQERRRTNTSGVKGRHFVPMVWLRLDGDKAEADSYFQFINSAVSPPALQLVGHYTDRFERTPDGWKLAYRDITFG